MTGDQTKPSNEYVASVRDLLREETDSELATREGEWRAFTSGVLRRIEAVERAPLRMSYEDQAIAQLQETVSTELEQISPRFEESFRESIEHRIWREARASRQPSIVGRIRVQATRALVMLRGLGETLDRLRAPIGVGLAAACAAGLLVYSNDSTTPLDSVHSGAQVSFQPAASAVLVEQVSFAGDVLLVPEENLTVIYLSQAAG